MKTKEMTGKIVIIETEDGYVLLGGEESPEQEE